MANHKIHEFCEDRSPLSYARGSRYGFFKSLEKNDIKNYLGKIKIIIFDKA